MKSYLDAALAGKNDWWRYLIGYPIILFAWQLVGAIPVIAMAFVVMLDNDPQTNIVSTGFVGIDPLLNFSVNVFSFIPFILAIIATVTLIHKRPLRTLITAGSKMDWKRFFASFGVWFALAGLAAFLEAVLYPGRYTFTPRLAQLIPFALIGLLTIPIQTSSEEFFFRGYLLQNLGLKIKNPWVLCPLSGILFMLPHLLNPEVAVDAILLPLYYFFFGAFATWITLRSNGLELTLGLHMGNNLLGLIFVNATVTVMPTPSLFTVNELDAVYSLVSALAAMAVFYVVMFKVWPQKATPVTVES